ncbi:MAG: AsmA-like C-terminal region-containing protein, partial [Janthinobacterium lividum]
KAEGSILLEPFTWNFVYALNSINIASLCDVLPKGFLNNVGGMSIGGMLTTNGDNIEKLLYNLYSKSSFIVKDAEINNFSIDDFIDNFYSISYNTANITTDLQLALLTGQTDVDTLKGDLELSQGVLNLKNTSLKTKESIASIVASINLYSFALNLDALFSFHPRSQLRALQGTISRPMQLGVNVLGTIFAPQKTSDSDKFIQMLNTPDKSRVDPYLKIRK